MSNYEGSTLYLEDISKTFGRIQALNKVKMKIMPGEIHGLLGQNGCGKSTLIKILSGYFVPDEGGKLWINGQQVYFPLESGAFNNYHMSFVHQDLGLIPDLTVLENFEIGKIAISNSMHINWEQKAAYVQKIFQKYQIDIRLKDEVASLSQMEKALLAIVRAVESIRQSSKSDHSTKGLLVLDEPTVFLPRAQVDMLFQLVRSVAAEGISVLFVSHDLDEVMELTDTITVLRDGRNVSDLVTNKTTKEEVVQAILGRELKVYQRNLNSQPVHSQTAVQIKQVCGELVKNVSFHVRAGEVLGLTGLVGSGFEEMPYLLFGATDRLTDVNGKMIIAEKQIDLKKMTQKEALQEGIALIPADRATQGGLLDLSILDNMMMLMLYRYNSKRLNFKKMFQDCQKLLTKFEVNVHDPQLCFGDLSGGNQQKVLLAKWLQIRPKLLILHEPTQGVDIGARQQVFRHIATATKSGTAVICSSSDYEQLAQICNRVLIFSQGHLAKELVHEEVTKENITRYCYNSGGKTDQFLKNRMTENNFENMQVKAI